MKTADLKVLIVGSGGREHALAKAFNNSQSVKQTYLWPGRPGQEIDAILVGQRVDQFTEIEKFCKDESIDLVFVGPEEPLVNGLSDQLRAQHIPVIGPSKAAALLEGSKVFAKEFMNAAGIPTAKFEIVESVEETQQAAKNFTPPYVLKADGLAAGKGVVICKTIHELQEAAIQFFEKQIFGRASRRAVLEQFQPGWESSYLITTNGEKWQALPLAQDHKRLKDLDQGPNTGGMGAIAPISIDSKLDQLIQTQIIEPTLKELTARDHLYRGVLYFGIMVTEDGPSLLEYNCRLGDPETQVLLPLIQNDLGIYFMNLAQGQVDPIQVIADRFASIVVLAAKGYPEKPEVGDAISGPTMSSQKNSYFIFSGTSRTDSNLCVHGGRVMGAVGLGNDLSSSLQAAYSQARFVNWPGLQMRSDIGKAYQAQRKPN